MIISIAMLKDLDVKKVIEIFDHPVHGYRKLVVNQPMPSLLVIDDFFTDSDCLNVLKNVNSHITPLDGCYDTQFRDGGRLLTFDRNDHFTRYIERLLQEIPQLNQIKPYGFGTHRAEWKCMGAINPLLRFNRYTAPSVGFKKHRDSQYVGPVNIHSPKARSAWSLLVYLDDNTATTSFVHENKTIDVTSKKGRAVIFDQRLEHWGSEVLVGQKTIMRTDIMMQTNDSIVLTVEELSLRDLAIRLFRQAQYLELEKDSINAQKFYSQSVDIRATGRVPENLEEIQIISQKVRLSDQLQYVGRSSGIYVFETQLVSGKAYEGRDPIHQLSDDVLKVVGLYCLVTETSTITGSDSGDWLALSKSIGLDADSINVRDALKVTNNVPSHQWMNRINRKQVPKTGDDIEEWTDDSNGSDLFAQIDPSMRLRDQNLTDRMPSASSPGIVCRVSGKSVTSHYACLYHKGCTDCEGYSPPNSGKQYIPCDVTNIIASYDDLDLEVHRDEYDDHAMIITTCKSESFNHASCDSYAAVCGKVPDEDEVKYTMIRYDMYCTLRGKEDMMDERPETRGMQNLSNDKLYLILSLYPNIEM
jgi:hypothetical protein